MKTCVCWDTCGERKPLFFELEGDKTRFDSIYINSAGDEAHEALVKELTEIVFDENGNEKIDLYIMPPSRDYDYFITCGILP